MRGTSRGRGGQSMSSRGRGNQRGGGGSSHSSFKGQFRGRGGLRGSSASPSRGSRPLKSPGFFGRSQVQNVSGFQSSFSANPNASNMFNKVNRQAQDERRYSRPDYSTINQSTFVYGQSNESLGAGQSYYGKKGNQHQSNVYRDRQQRQSFGSTKNQSRPYFGETEQTFQQSASRNNFPKEQQSYRHYTDETSDGNGGTKHVHSPSPKRRRSDYSRGDEVDSSFAPSSSDFGLSTSAFSATVDDSALNRQRSPPYEKTNQNHRSGSSDPQNTFAIPRGRGRGRGRGMNSRGNKSGRGNSNTGGGKGEEAKKVSALKRLGPKLSITERLGSKKLKKKKKSNIVESSSNPSNGSSSQNRDKDGQKPDKKMSNEERRKNFIRLECPHCKASSVTFQEYGKHLKTDSHVQSMIKLKNSLLLTLGRMRTKQRLQQRELETSLEKEGKLNDENGKKFPPVYCKTCKLMFHQPRAEHTKSEMHKLISNFLNPLCNICETQFFSPMAYETHLATLDHIKSLSKAEGTGASENLEKSINYEKQEAMEEDEDLDFDEENFMTLDEVGGEDEEEVVLEKGEKQIENENDKDKGDEAKVDKVEGCKVTIEKESPKENKNDEGKSESGTDEIDKAKIDKTKETKVEKEETFLTSEPDSDDKKQENEEENSENAGKLNEIKVEEKKEEILESQTAQVKKEIDENLPIGQDYLSKVEMYFCDLCHKFLPRADPSKIAEVIKAHCTTQSHRSAFYRKEEELLAAANLKESDVEVEIKAEEEMNENEEEIAKQPPEGESEIGDVEVAGTRNELERFEEDDDALDFEADEASIDGDGV